MPVTESTILTPFLLRPAALPSITTLPQFTTFFPHSGQTSPEVARLYRSLQHQRALLLDRVAETISIEAKRGLVQQRAVVAARRRAEGRSADYGKEEEDEEDEEVLLEKALFAQTSHLPASRPPHTLRSILPALDTAAEDISAEISTLEDEAKALMEEIIGVVGGLSDLRYGRFVNAGVAEDVMDGLKGVEAVCEGK